MQPAISIPLASSGLRAQDIEEINKVLFSGNLTMGKVVREFEAEMARYLGVKHFVMVNSGSSANLLMIEALLRPTNSHPLLNQGDGVLVPAIAWPTTVWPLIQLGLKPIFVDIDRETLALNLDSAQKLIDETGIPVRGIFPIHPLGLALSHRELLSFADKNNLVLISDVCESLGSWIEGRHAGVSSVASSFSFYFSHHITTMEGGGVATDDDAIADDLKSMRSHGWSRDRSDAALWSSDSTTTDAKFLFVSTGYNVRPMEIQAAVGISQLSSLEDFVTRRRSIASQVIKALEGTRMSVIGQGHLLETERERSHSWMLIPIRVHGPDLQIRRKNILEFLTAAGVETRPVLTGNFLAQPAVQRIFRQSLTPDAFPEATHVSQSTFLVGAHHDLSDSQIAYLCDALVMAESD
jgi:CDP-6-deoxy-D-xylo-4-hexulose-3-dehydrase